MSIRRVLITSYFYEFRFGGAELVARTLKRNLEQRRGLVVDVLCFGGSTTPEPETNIYRLPIPNLWWRAPQLCKRLILFLNNSWFDRWVFSRTKRLSLAWSEYDLIHCQDLNALRTTDWLADLHNKPLVFTLHDNFPKTLHPGQANALITSKVNRVLRRRARQLFPSLCRSQPVICVSKFIRKRLLEFPPMQREGISPRAEVIYSPTEEYLGKVPGNGHARDNGTVKLLFIGRLSKEKGIDLLVRALAELPSNMRLSIVGPEGPLSPWIQAMAQRDPRLELRAPVPHTEVQRIMLDHDVICCPSMFEEPFGKTVLEARLAQRPLVATNLGGIPEITAGYPRAVLVHPTDKSESDLVKDLGLAIRQALTSGAIPLDQASETRFLSQFSLDASLDAHLHAYERVTSRACEPEPRNSKQETPAGREGASAR